jgi:uncharacterized protein YegL
MICVFRRNIMVLVLICLLGLPVGTVVADDAVGLANVPRDLVLIIDTSNSMAGQPLEDAKVAAKGFCENILRNPGARIAIVSFGGSGHVLCEFSRDIDMMNDEIDKLRSGNGTNTNSALRKAEEMLRVFARSGAIKGIVLLSDGTPTVGDSTLLGATRYDKETFGHYANCASAVYDYARKSLQGLDIWTIYFASTSNTYKPEDVRLGRTLLKDLQNRGYYDASMGDDIDWTLDLISGDIATTDPFDKEHEIWFQSYLPNVSDNPWHSIIVPWRRSFFEQSPTEYNHELALVCSALSASTGAYIGSSVGYESLLTLGFRDIESHNFDIVDTQFEGDDGLVYTLGQQLVEINGEMRQLFILLMRGTSGAFLVGKEWQSNFRFNPDSDYCHSGFHAAALKAYGSLQEYVSTHSDETAENLFIITGHSRGGATANLVGWEMTRNRFSSPAQTYVYTFATPNTMLNMSISASMNIHNVVNRSDMITLLPFALESEVTTDDGQLVKTAFMKQGNVWSYDGASPEMLEKLSELVGKDTSREDFKELLIVDDIYLHDYAPYLAWLLTQNPALSKPYWIDWQYLIIRCPVNVEVYTTDGQLVAKIEHNKVIDDVQNGHIMAAVDGDDKYLILPKNETFEIRLTAYDFGTMTYERQEFDEDGEAHTTTYQNVVLAPDKQFLSQVSSGEANLQLVENNQVIGTVAEDGSELLDNEPSDEAVAEEDNEPEPDNNQSDNGPFEFLSDPHYLVAFEAGLILGMIVILAIWLAFKILRRKFKK